MIRSIRNLLIAVAVSVLAAACSWSGPPVDRAPVAREAPRNALAALDAEPVRMRAAQGTRYEWRDAYPFSGGEEHVVDLGPAEPGTVLRLGLLDRTGVRVHARLVSGGETLREFESEGTAAWQDWRVPLGAAGGRGRDARLVLRADAGFWLSTAELATANYPATHVIIVLVDTLRQDHLGCYGYARATSPNIDAFARDAVRFSQLVPSSSWTRPSVASLLTSTHPEMHGGQDRGDVLRPGLQWLPVVLADAGYETHGIMTNPNCLPIWGIGDDFFRYLDAGATDWLTLDDAVAVDAALETMQSSADRPTLLYLHLMAPHEPYDPPEPYRSEFAPVGLERPLRIIRQTALGLYDAEIAYADAQLGRFFDGLKALGVYDQSLILFLSDHGQEFWDHGGTGHGKTLYEEQLRVPLIVKLPHSAHAGAVRHGLIEMVDIAPTLLHLLELPAESRFQGVSFRDLFLRDRPAGRIGYASLHLDDRAIHAAKTAEVKYIHDLVAGEERWYDLEGDAQEKKGLQEPPAGAEALAAHVQLMSSMGAAGLHILVTHDSTRDVEVRGSVTSSAAMRASLRYPEELSEVSHEGDTVSFTFRMPMASDPLLPSTHWQRVTQTDDLMRRVAYVFEGELRSEQDNAELTLDLPEDATFTLALEMDGAPVPEELVHLGRAKSVVILDGAPLRVADLVAPPSLFDPAGLPRELAVYVWYVPAVTGIEAEALDPGLRESLRALGYFN